MQLRNKVSQVNAVSSGSLRTDRVSYLFAVFAAPPLIKHIKAFQVAQSSRCDWVIVQGQSEQRCTVREYFWRHRSQPAVCQQ